jgi:hypothetical protein
VLPAMLLLKFIMIAAESPCWRYGFSVILKRALLPERLPLSCCPCAVRHVVDKF